MPGILGFITQAPREQVEPRLQRMLATLRHGSNYVTGTWADESLGLYVGWAERNGSFAESKPLRNETGDTILIFSGEEFPDPATAGQLQQRGHRLDADSCSYLVHLSEEEPSFPAGLNGWFHGVLVDRKTGTATLFNDRYGLHRLYYHDTKEGFYFAAEAKAILAVCPELRSLDPQSLGEYVACGCVLENRSLFSALQVLPVASKWTFCQGALASRSSYFHPQEWEQQEPLAPEAYYRELRGVFSRNLPRYFSGNQKVAISLTGGLDTRMIMAWHRSAPDSLPCYSFGGMIRDSRDVIVARQVAKACGQPHHVIAVGQDFLSKFSDYAERTIYLSDACVGVDYSPDLYAHERAAEIAPVRMTGNFGSEVLRGVRGLKATKPALRLFVPEVLQQAELAQQTCGRAFQAHPLSFVAFRQVPWYHYGLLGMQETQLSVRSPYLDNDFVRTVFRAPQRERTDSDVSLRLIREGDRALSRIRTDRGFSANGSRVSAALSHWFQEFTFKAEYAYDYGMPQWLVRIDHALAPLHLENVFLGRHKFGHFRVWYRDLLANCVREMLLDSRSLSRSYLERRSVEAVVNGHISGKANYTTAIHKMLSLEYVHRLFVDPQ
jgi:asparagine synthase (glutamine-hydrolysing)